MIRSVWAIPVVLGVVMLAGLVVALTGDGWRDAVSWVGLSAPVIALVWAMGRRS